jgi:hypothetical protein
MLSSHSNLKQLLGVGLDNPATVALLDKAATRYYAWHDYANIVVRYENIVKDKVGHVNWLSTILYPDTVVDAEGVVATVERLARTKAGRCLPTLLGAGHASGVGVGGWREHLPTDVAAYMLDRYGSWFEDHGYPKPDLKGTTHD